MRTLPRFGAAPLTLAAPIALIALAVLLGAIGTPSLEGIVALALCNLVIVIGLQVFIGNSGIYSFGQLGFATAGAYIAALLTVPAAFAAFQTPALPSLFAGAELSPLVATLLASAGAALLAAIVGLPLMRASTLAIPISTFAFGIVAYNVVANWDAVTGGSGGLVSIPRSTDPTLAGIWAIIAVLIALAYKRSASGQRLVATRESEVAARSLGIGLMRERMIGFVLSAALCGAGAALAVQQAGVLTPNSFYFSATVTTLTMLVLGGAGSVFGATLGTLAVTAVNEVLRTFGEGHSLLGLPALGEIPGFAAIGLGAILLITMLVRPRGLTDGREAGEIWGRSKSLPSERPLGSHADVEERDSRQCNEKQRLEAASVSLSIGGLEVLREVTISLGHGEILGLIGPNGAGKTTLVNVLSGFQQADRGSLRLDGVEAAGRTPAQLAHLGLARSFQAALPFSGLSCLDNIAIGAMGVGVGRRAAAAEARSVLACLGLSGTERHRAGALPAGSQRLLGIGRALATRPRYLLLDEPAAGLNEEEGVELVAALRAIVADFGCGLLVIEHDMSVVMDLCPQIIVLDQGRVVAAGSPEGIQNDAAVIASYLGSSYAADLDA